MMRTHANIKGIALLESAAILAVMCAVIWLGFCVTAYIQALTGLKEVINRHAAAINIKPLKVSAGNQGYFVNNMLRQYPTDSNTYPLGEMLKTHAQALRADIRALLGCQVTDCPERYAIVLRYLVMPVNMISGAIDKGVCDFNPAMEICTRTAFKASASKEPAQPGDPICETFASYGKLGRAIRDSRAAIIPVLRQGCQKQPFAYSVPGPLQNVRYIQYYGQSEVREDEAAGVEHWQQNQINYLRYAPLVQLYVSVDLSGNFMDPRLAGWLSSGKENRGGGVLLFTDQRILPARVEL